MNLKWIWRAIISLLIIIIIFTFHSETATAATHNKKVWGYVWDSAGTPIEDANITVNMWNGTTLVKTKWNLTDVDGMYKLNFVTFQWDIGNTIEVISTYNSQQETNSTIADDSGTQYVNVTYSFQIPEFGSIAGFLLAGVTLGAIAIFFIYRMRD